MKLNQTNIVKAVIYLLSALCAAISIAFGLSSCSVVRTVTTSSQYVQKGDTSLMIQTKTVERYDGQKNK